MPDYAHLPWLQMNDYMMEIGTARNVDQLLHLALTRIGTLIPFDDAGIIGYINTPDKAIYRETLGGTEAGIRAFQEYYCHLMPDVGLKRIKFGATDWNDYRHSEYVTDFIRPQNVRYSAGITKLGTNQSGDLSISINRTNDLPKFNEAELKVLELLQGHLSNFIAMLSQANPDELYPDARDIHGAFNRLTRRESEIAALLCRKYSAEMIGSRLLISPLTVYKHIENIYDKMNVNCRKDLRVKILGEDIGD